MDDLLPPTHAVSAFNKVVTLGVGLSDILFYGIHRLEPDFLDLDGHSLGPYFCVHGR